MHNTDFMANKQTLNPPWQPGQSGNPNGRPKNRVINEWLPKCLGKKKARAASPMRQEEIDAWEQRLLVTPITDVEQIADWEQCPAYAKSLARSILCDHRNGRTTTIDKLRERQYGKPIQKIELTGADGSPLMQGPKLMTQEEAREFLRSLDKEY